MTRSYTITKDDAIWRDVMELGTTPYIYAAKFGKDHKGHLLVEFWPREDCPLIVEKAATGIAQALAASEIDVRYFHATMVRDIVTFTAGFMAWKPRQEGCPRSAVVLKKEEYRFGQQINILAMEHLHMFSEDIYMCRLYRDAEEKGILLRGLPKVLTFGRASEAIKEFVAAEYRSVGLSPPLPEPSVGDERISHELLLDQILEDFKACSHWPESEDCSHCRNECPFVQACQAVTIYDESKP